jgi:hypothetical protein
VENVCKSFSYWGSTTYPETVTVDGGEVGLEVYSDLDFSDATPDNRYLIYEECYLYSNFEIDPRISDYYDDDLDYDNGKLLPSYDEPFDDFTEMFMVDYDPLHEREADTDSPVGEGYGDWKGKYYRITDYEYVSGMLTDDIEREVLVEVTAPIGDASVYKFPPVGAEPEPQDINNFKIGYAYFLADMSMAGDCCFDPTVEACRFPGAYVIPAGKTK